jgi:glutamine---fructose-6-phosphate transaminase (isomerizing)
MCGIFGLITLPSAAVQESSWHTAIKQLFLLSESRGKEASGIALSTAERIVVHKDSVSASRMIRTESFRNATQPLVAGHFGAAGAGSYLGAIGHSRLVTNGLQGIDANNQPVLHGDFVLVHNGIVVNVADIWQSLSRSPKADVDTEVIGALLQSGLESGKTIQEAAIDAFAEIYGETSIAAFHKRSDTLLLATNTGSLYFSVNRQRDVFFFASEEHICEAFISRTEIAGFEGAKIEQVRPGYGALLDCRNISIEKFSLDRGQSPLPSPQIAPLLQVQKNVEDKAERIRAARDAMRRCTSCLLPESMPYISFDQSGVCNYCANYRPFRPKDDSAIRAEFDKIRSKDGSPDCVVAFSGGRDSSYGLHLLKTKYDMNPIAYTYDWGMVTDLARRNQARMCGSLGIEHIWLSADIKTKRAHVRRNVEAWLRKPDLGIIPLFMAGDKQFFWYANETMKKTGISTMVFCTNRLEKTDFKTGFLGLRPKDTEMRNNPSSLGIGPKAAMAWQYGHRFLGNPHYLNKSIPDTLWAYASYYLINQDHLYLFDYLDWQEEIVDRTLIDQYGWETAKDSDSTWRIGDGTAPFYNHIYYTVAGFTEYDTFRSNQVREGMLTREKALALVKKENEPRWASIRDYFNTINSDFDEAMRVIDRIPKLYMD